MSKREFFSEAIGRTTKATPADVFELPAAKPARPAKPPVRRRTVYLTDANFDRLRRYAFDRRVALSDVLAAAVDEYLAGKEIPERIPDKAERLKDGDEDNVPQPE